jgi:hypothetical protein
VFVIFEGLTIDSTDEPSDVTLDPKFKTVLERVLPISEIKFIYKVINY